jgi:hypothetical protein
VADTNPWSAEGWNLTAQATYLKAYGRARAEARARDAGSFLGATTPPGGFKATGKFGKPLPKIAPPKPGAHPTPPALTQPPKALGLFTDHLTDHQKRVLYFVRHKKRTNATLIPPVQIGLGMDMAYEEHFTVPLHDFGLTFDFDQTNLYREIDITLNPGEFSFSVRFHVGFDGPRSVFGEVAPIFPGHFALGFDQSQPPVELGRLINNVTMRMGFDSNRPAFGDERQITVDMDVGFSESYLFNEYNAGVFNFGMGFIEAAVVDQTIPVPIGLGFDADATTSSEISFIVTQDMGFDLTTETATVKLTVPVDVGFDMAAVTYTEVNIAATKQLGFNEAAQVTRERDLTATVDMGFTQITGQPYLPIDAAMDFGVDMAATTDRLFNFISTHSLGFDATVLVETGLTADMDMGFTEYAAVQLERNTTQDMHVGFSEDATLSVLKFLSVTNDMGVSMDVVFQPTVDFASNPLVGFDEAADVRALEPRLYGEFITKHDSSTDVVSFSANVGKGGDTQTIVIVISMQRGAGINNVSDVNIGAVNNATLVRRQSYGGIAQTEIWYAQIQGPTLLIEYLLSNPQASSCAVYSIINGVEGASTVYLMDSGGDTQTGTTEASTTVETEKDTGFIIAGSINSSSVGVTTGPPQLTLDDNTGERRFFSGVSSLNVDSFPIDVTFGQSKLIAVGSFSAFRRADVVATPDMGFAMAATLSRTQQNLFPSYAFGLDMAAPVQSAFGASNSIGFSMASNLIVERSLTVAPALGFSESAPVQLIKNLTAAPGMGFSEAAAVTTAAAMVVTFRGAEASGSAAGPQTFSQGGLQYSFGAADANNWTVVAVYYGTAGIRVPTVVTIGGVSATRACRSTVVAGRSVDIWYANTTAGGSGNVVVTYGGNTNNGSVAVWSCLGPLDTAHITTDTNGNSNTYTPGLSVNKANAAGFAVGCTTSGNTVTFTTPSSGDAQANQAVATTYRYAAGHGNLLPTSTWNVSLSVTTGGNLTNWASAVFPPT